MKIINNFKNNVYYYLLCLLAFCIPTFNNFTIVIFLVMLSFSLVGIITDWEKFKIVLKEYTLIVLGFPLIFAILSISILYTDNQIDGLRDVFKCAIFLVAPISLYESKSIGKDKHERVLKCFVYGVLASLGFSFFSIINEFIDGDFKNLYVEGEQLNYIFDRFSYHNFVKPLRVNHAIYFAAYLLVAYNIVLGKNIFKIKSIKNIVITVLLSSIILLCPIIISLSGLVVFSISEVINKKNVETIKHKKFILFWLFVTSYLIVFKLHPHKHYFYFFESLRFNSILFSLMFVGYLTINFSIVIIKKYNIKVTALFTFLFISFILMAVFFISYQSLDMTFFNSNFSARIFNNYASVLVLKNEFLCGVGVGDVQQELRKAYGLLNYPIVTHNEHNQYFRFWMSSGFLCLITYILYLLAILKNACLKKNIVMISSVVTLILFSFTESVLSRQMGTTFFLFIIYLEFYNNYETR